MSAVGDWETTLLASWERGQRLGAVGPGPTRRHLLHGLALARHIETQLPATGVPCLDLGSGAGIPGLVLAGRWPTSTWVLVEAAARRVRLLAETIAALDWGERVSVVHGRAEDVARQRAHRGCYSLVVARSFGPPAVVAECGVGFLAEGGALAVSEPPGGNADRWPSDGLLTLGLATVRSAGTADGDASVQLLRRVGPVPERFPRRAGVPARHPLF